MVVGGREGIGRMGIGGLGSCVYYISALSVSVGSLCIFPLSCVTA